VITLIIRLKIAIYRLAKYPQQSLRVFFVGILMFAMGLGALWLNQQHDNWLAQVGVVTICLGLLISACGWVGIFAHRLAQIINRAEQARKSINR